MKHVTCECGIALM